MTSCSTASAARPHGFGQCGMHVAGVDQPRALRVPSSAASSVGERAHLGPRSPRPRAAGRTRGRGRRRPATSAVTVSAAASSASNSAASAVARRRQRWRVVLPGEADAAVHLDVELRVPVERPGARAWPRRRRPARTASASPFAARAGVPHRGGRELGGDEHVGAVVLHRLEHRDRSPELLTLLGVRGRGFDALLRAAGRLGGGERPRHRCAIGERAAQDRARVHLACP